MTTKPKTRKAPAPGANPKMSKMLALAAKIDVAKANYLSLSARAADRISDTAIEEIYKWEDKLAKVVATNLSELALKVRYVDVDDPRDGIAESIIRDLLAIGGNPEPVEPWGFAP